MFAVFPFKMKEYTRLLLPNSSPPTKKLAKELNPCYKILTEKLIVNCHAYFCLIRIKSKS